MISRKTTSDRIFDAFNAILMVFVIFLTLYPFWHVLVGSLNEGMDYMRGGVYFWPRTFTLENYVTVLNNQRIGSAYRVTILRTIIGTLTHLTITSTFAYAFSRKNLLGKNIYATIGLIPMFFGGGLIPTYILYQRLGLLDNFLVYILPGMFSFWNVLIFQSFFREIPDSISESAKLDGANEYTIFAKLILPLSKAVFAAIALFVGVGHWNTFFDAMMFTRSQELQVLQVFLMRVIRTREAAATLVENLPREVAEARTVTSTSVQMATMMIAAGPIILIYPFLQKYFVKGIMIGSVKG